MTIKLPVAAGICRVGEAMPVLPAVLSTTVPPGFSSWRFLRLQQDSRAARSLTGAAGVHGFGFAEGLAPVSRTELVQANQRRVAHRPRILADRGLTVPCPGSTRWLGCLPIKRGPCRKVKRTLLSYGRG